MRVRTALFVYASIVSAALLAAPLAQGENALVVGNCKSGLFEALTIQEAVNSLAPGGIVYICPGNHAEQVVINKNITLTGVGGNGNTGNTASGANNPTVVPPAGGLLANATDLYSGQPPIAAQIAVVTASGARTPIMVNISNLIIDGTNNGVDGCTPNVVGIFYQNASGIVDHVTTRYQYQGGNALNGCQSGLGISAEENGSYGNTKITIENSSVHDYNKNGITVDGVNVAGNVTATVSGNYVVGVGATPVTAQNGIQISDGATGRVTSNTVTDDVYVNPSPCGGNTEPACYSASGILLYDSGGTSTTAFVVESNTVSNTQGAIVAIGDTNGNADYISAVSNKITTSPAAGIYNIDGIDLCGNNDTAASNNVYNSSGSGVHIDSTCTEASGTSGNNTTATKNTVVEACAGVLLGNGTGSSATSNTTYDVLQTTYAGDTCPSNDPGPQKLGQKHQPSPYARASN